MAHGRPLHVLVTVMCGVLLAAGAAACSSGGSSSSTVAPITVISALLFYFGYVSSRAQYAYFGVDVDTIGLSTQDYVMRSPQPLLVPLLTLVMIAVALVALHLAVSA